MTLSYATTRPVDVPPLVAFTVYGDPEPGGSKKAVPIGKGRYGVVDANPRAKPWKTQVAQVAGEHFTGELLNGPLVAEFTFFQPRPRSHFGTGRNAGVLKPSAPEFPTVRPDALKMARLVEDALSRVLYRDDAQIVTEMLKKRYGSPARCEVQVWELPVGGDEGSGT